MTDSATWFYAIFSPSRNAWLNAYGEYGPCSEADQFPNIDKTVPLDGDQRWVGPIAPGEYA